MNPGIVMYRAALTCLVLAILPPACARAGEPDVGAWKSPVMDLAGIIPDSDERRLNSFLLEYQKRVKAQIAVLTVKSLGNRDIAMFAVEVGEKWGVGDKEKDNGIVIVIAPKERKYFTATGYGVEGVLPDSLVGELQRRILVPYFRKGKFGTGIREYVHQLAVRVAREEGRDISDIVGMLGASGKALPQSHKSGPRGRPGEDGIIFILIFFIVFLVVALVLRFTGVNSRGASYGGSSFGGGFGSGSSFGGGFSGGMGGSFGGGGAGGGW